MSFERRNLCEATGFFYCYNNERFLVSNWHVFSGRDPRSGQPICQHGGVPDEVDLPLHCHNEIGRCRSYTAKLSDEFGIAKWLQHPTGQQIDVAVYPVSDIPEDSRVFPLPFTNEYDIELQVTADVYIVGYPRGISQKGIFPVWKRGSVATEPELPYRNAPKFLVDSATREGMSGSPVFLRKPGVRTEIVNGQAEMRSCQLTRFVGVYSGRYGAKEDEAVQLGIVWHRSVIHETIEARVKGTYLLNSSLT